MMRMHTKLYMKSFQKQQQQLQNIFANLQPVFKLNKGKNLKKQQTATSYRIKYKRNTETCLQNILSKKNLSFKSIFNIPRDI